MCNHHTHPTTCVCTFHRFGLRCVEKLIQAKCALEFKQSESVQTEAEMLLNESIIRTSASVTFTGHLKYVAAEQGQQLREETYPCRFKGSTMEKDTTRISLEYIITRIRKMEKEQSTRLLTPKAENNRFRLHLPKLPDSRKAHRIFLTHYIDNIKLYA